MFVYCRDRKGGREREGKEGREVGRGRGRERDRGRRGRKGRWGGKKTGKNILKICTWTTSNLFIDTLR